MADPQIPAAPSAPSSPELPIGLFDSGVGGLSVAQAVRELLPGENLVYVADSAYCPYGGRPTAEIRARALAIGRFLYRWPVKLIVVASNTTTGAGLEALRAELGVPIVGVEPAIKPAAAATRNGRIGVMATQSTLASERFRRLVATFAGRARIFPIACPGLVEYVEAGETDGPRVLSLLAELLAPLRENQVDTVVLACTHYPFVRAAVAAVLGPGVQLIETGPAVARQVMHLLQERELRSRRAAGRMQLFTTGDPLTVGQVANRLWGDRVTVGRLAI